jgi:hypothetical protein
VSKWPDYISVVFRPRQMGKTSLIMDDIHELAVQNRTTEVLVVVPSASHREFWERVWRNKYPALRPPAFLSLQNTLSVRGRRYEKIYVEDIDLEPEGIYSEKLRDILPCLAWAREPELIFTCSPLPFEFEPPHLQQRREAEEKVQARKARRRFMDQLIVGYVAATGKMPKLPDRILNGR